MNQLLAYCGLDCSQCPALIATRAGDISRLTSLAQEWFDGVTDHTIILCDGCSGTGRTMKWCAECPTRNCARQRGLPNCAHCSDYGCDKLMMVFSQSKEAKANLDRIRASL
jgi:hypothetical protein